METVASDGCMSGGVVFGGQVISASVWGLVLTQLVDKWESSLVKEHIYSKRVHRFPALDCNSLKAAGFPEKWS